MIGASNKSLNRISGDHAGREFGHLGVPLIGYFIRWVLAKVMTHSIRLLLWWGMVTIAGYSGRAEQPTEGPVFNGKPLSSWVDEVGLLSRYTVVKANVPEVQAVRTIGTNAIPWLLDELTSYPPSPENASLTRQELRAISGFWALGEGGAPAIPSLLRLLEGRPVVASQALAGIGKPTLLAFERCLTNAPHYVPPYLLSQVPGSRIVPHILSGLYEAISVSRVSKSDAAFLLPSIRSWAQDTHKEANYWANGILGEFGLDPMTAEETAPNHSLQRMPR